MYKIIHGDNNSLEQQLVKALFGSDEELIQALIKELESKSIENDKKLTLIVNNTKA